MAEANYDPNAQFNLIYDAQVKRLEKLHQKELEAIADQKAAELKVIQDTLQDETKKAEAIAKLNEVITKKRAKAENDHTAELEKAKKASLQTLETYEYNILKGVEVKKRIQVRQAKIARLKDLKTEFEKRLAQEELLNLEQQRLDNELREAKSEQDRAALQEELAQIKQQQAEIAKYKEENQSKFNTADSDILNTKREIAKEAMASGDSEALKEVANDLKEAAKNQNLTAEEARKLNREALEYENAARQEEARQKNAAIKAELKYRLTTLDGIKDTIADGLMKMASGLGKMFDSLEEPINAFYQYQAKYESRMQGSGNDYNKMATNMGFTIGMSPFVNQKVMMEKLQTLIDTGTNYNLELRAYIATMSENLASTFNAFDSNLLRLIRIQQSDSTAARLGIETALTNTLNSMYKDSSYLTDVSDSVTQALLDASAQLTHQGAAEMEFVAQKWLGSLYSLGISSDAVQTIATGLGYLGSGNIEALTGNESLMNLMTMGASKAGMSITDILTGNLTADNTNKLLKGITEYLAEIAGNTDMNNVTRSSIGQVFGISNTDLRSIANLTTEDFKTIYDTSLNYSQALAEASSEIKQIGKRTHISQMVNNLMDNATTSSALMIGGNAVTYTLYKALNVISGLVGDRGLEIPGIQVVGSGTASGIDVLSIAKAAIAGGGLLASLIGSAGNLGSGGLPALSRWEGYEESLSRGSDFSMPDYGIDSGFSENTVYQNKGNQSSSDLTSAGMQDATQTAKENQSSDDQETGDQAKKFYDEGLKHLEAMASAIIAAKAENDASSLRVIVNTASQEAIPVKLDASSGTINTQLSGISNDTQLLLVRLLKTGLFTNIDLNNDNSLDFAGRDSLDIFDLLNSRLNGLQVEVVNDASNPVQVSLGVGGM